MAVSRTRKQVDPWEGYEFIDINSHSGEPPQRPRASQRSRTAQHPASSRRERTRPSSSRSQRGQPPREPPRRERPQRGSPQRGSPRRERERPSKQRRPRPPKERAPRKPMSKVARRFLLIFTLLCMVAITAFLCVFLLFKVRDIEITGDVVYEQSDILNVCGYEIGDNLALLSVKDEEEALVQQLPYIEDVDIIRHFPSTLEIHITGAKEAACISSSGQWYAVSSSGKILEAKSEADTGVMQVTGLTLTDPKPGSQFQAQDEDYQSAFQTILTALAGMDGLGDFTTLDLTDLYNITMNYQDRILFQLGSTVQLDYKLDLGYRLVTQKLESNDSGTLNLTLAGDVKKAFFTASTSGTDTSGNTSSGGEGESGQNGSSETDSDATTDSGGDDTSQEEDNTSDDTTDGEEDSTSDEAGSSTEEGRGGDIPDSIFTG